MTIQSILRSMHGVWHGTYTVMKPDGTLIERFESQQEGRMEGTDWTEKVIYRKAGKPGGTRHFHAIVDACPQAGDRAAKGGDRKGTGNFGACNSPIQKALWLSASNPSSGPRKAPNSQYFQCSSKA